MKNKTKAREQYRQGDILIERIEKSPAVKMHRRTVLAEGELTGHAHEIQDAQSASLSDPIDGWTIPGDHDDRRSLIALLLSVQKCTAVQHQEHSPVKVSPDDHRVTRQREYAPAELRQVRD